MDLQIGKIERGQNGMKVYNSKDLSEEVELLKITIKNLEKTISDLEKKVDDMQPDISEVEYPK